MSVTKVCEILSNLDLFKASGPDDISSRLLKYTTAAISPSICRSFNMSNELATIANACKRANFLPVYKKDDASLADSYRPISLLCVLSKVLQRCILDYCLLHVSTFLYNMHYGFQRGRSTESQLLQVYHHTLFNLAQGKELDTIY